MKRSHTLFAIFIILALFSHRILFEAVRRLRGDAPRSVGVSCEYNGRAYALQEQRRAEDQCNVCTCEENGWSCTKFACAKGSDGAGTITGEISFPSEYLPVQQVCALDLKDEKEYCQPTRKGEKSFAVPVPAGDYDVYAMLQDDATGKRAYYSEFVRCGSGVECKDHTPIAVHVEAGGISEAQPQDWYAPGQFDLLNVTPSRYEYSTHNYYEGSVFQARGRGLVKVEFSSTAYPPQPDATYALVGEAALASEDRGIQTWTLPIPTGFQAMEVRAKGYSEDGSYLMSRILRIVRPIVTASASGTRL